MSKNLFLAFPLVCMATFMIVGGDTGGKLLASDGVSQMWVAWSRFAIASVVLLPFCALKRDELTSLLNWRIILRGGLIAGAICSILTAIKTEPFANAFGAFFIGPIVSYILSILLLKERVTWLRSILLAISFVGVLIVVRPSFAMSTGMMFALLAGTFHGSYLMTTRWLVGFYRPRFLLISQLMVGSVLLLPFAFTELPTFEAKHYGWLVISVFGSAFGNFMLVMVNRAIPATLVAPLMYTQLMSAVLLGYLVFAQRPDTQTMIGLAIIICAGLSSLWLARQKA